MHIAVWLTHPSVDCWNFTTAQAGTLHRALPGAEVTLCPGKDAFLGALPQADITIVWQFRQEWFARAPRLRWIATPAAGRDYFHITPPAGVDVTYGSFHGALMGETLVGMMLAFCRGILGAQRRQLAGELWPIAEIGKGIRPLRGSHVVILGFGAIGRHAGRLAKAFGVRITGIRRSTVPPPDWFGPGDRVATPAELDAILPTADHLLLVLPGDTGADRILDDRRLRLLPPHACICNVGRGNAIDEAALAAALREGRLAGACLDVFCQEPLPADSPLRNCPGVLIMPHASAISPDYLDLYLAEFVEVFRRGAWGARSRE